MNIRELDEESRKTGVWPPRRIILRVEREGEDAEPVDHGRPAAVKVGEVDLAAPRPAAPAKPRAVPAPLPAPSLSPSVTPSRRPGLPGARGVTPAPAVSPEDAAFAKWLEEPLAIAESEPEYQAPPEWLPGDVRLRAERRRGRVARKARTQVFGAGAATTLAVAGVAAVALVGISQTETVGGAVGVPSIGLFGTAPSPPEKQAKAETAAPKPAAKRPARRQARRQPTANRPRAARPAGASASRQSARNTAPASTSGSTAPRRAAANPPPPPPRQQASPPPAQSPPPPPSPPRNSAPQVPSRSTAPVAPSRPATSSPAPTSSSPAGSSPSLGGEPAL